MEKKLFIETIEAIEKQTMHDAKCNDALQSVFPEAFILLYDNDLLHKQIRKLLKVPFDDDNRDSWIDYYIDELEFGKKYKKGCATNADGSEINLSDAAHLYDFFLSNQKCRKN